MTCFSLFLLTGCHHTNPIAQAWIVPEKPVLEQPVFQKEGDRLFLEQKDAVILRNNLVEMKAYQEKLEFLVNKMKEHYK
jgi:hypothetical protein